MCAQKSLNGHYLKDVDVRLFVEWFHESEDDSAKGKNRHNFPSSASIDNSSTRDSSNSKINQIENKGNSKGVIDMWNKDPQNNQKNQYRNLPNLPPGMPVSRKIYL